MASTCGLRKKEWQCDRSFS